MPNNIYNPPLWTYSSMPNIRTNPNRLANASHMGTSP